nr:NHL repeat-containing protein 3 isoform X1 [Kogia breviceps]
MTRFWVCVAGAGFFLAFLVFHSRFCASRLTLPLHFAFKISWRAEEALYQLDVDWPKYSEYFTGTTFCVAVDSLNGLVYVAQVKQKRESEMLRNQNCFLAQSRRSAETAGVNVSEIPLTSACLKPSLCRIFLVECAAKQRLYGHTIKKYNSFGDLVQVLGTPGKKGTGLNPLQFDNPAELYVEDTGDVYIVDGDGGLNNRLIKLSQDFTILWLHGENGTGPAKFSIPHSVTVDSDGRVWVADRGNKRIQVFDKDTGEWLGAWNNCFSEEGPSAVRLTPDGKYLIVAQLNLSRLLVVAAPPVGSIGDCSVISTVQLADQVLPHLLDVSGKTGAIYVAEIGAKQVQKYIPMNSYFSSFGS